MPTARAQRKRLGRAGASATFCLLLVGGPSLPAEDLTLDAYVERVRDTHPFFAKEDLAGDIERQRQQGLLGAEDWSVFAEPSYDDRELPALSFGAPDRVRNAKLRAGLDRAFWATGGRMDLAYEYDDLRQDVPDAGFTLPTGERLDLAGPGRAYRNSVSLGYVQPLLRNRGGGLSRLEYDLQGYTAELSELQAMERQEEFILLQALRYLDWVLLHEDRHIAARRLDLAREEMAQTERKLEASLVEKVDLFRARDAVIQAEQGLRQVEAALAAVSAALAAQAGWDDIGERRPAFDLHARPPLPDQTTARKRLRDAGRSVRLLHVQLLQLDRERSALLDARRADLDLSVAGTLADGDERAGRAADFDLPGANVALRFRRAVQQRSVRADLQRVELERLQTEQALESVRLQQDAELRSLLARLEALAPVLDLGEEQVRTAAEKTREELRLYEQGRVQLTFVIQSRDDEVRAQGNYARNAAEYHALFQQVRALLDELLPDPEANDERP